MIEGMATNLFYDLLKGAGKAFYEGFHGDPEQQAMQAVYEHGFQAMLEETMADLDVEERSALYIKLRAFIERPNVSHLLLDLALKGKQPKQKDLKAEFEAQNLDPDEMMVFIDSFSAAFVDELLLAAEPAGSPLFNIVAVNELKTLSATLKDVKRDMKEMKRLLLRFTERLDKPHRAGAQAAVLWNDPTAVLEAPRKLIGRDEVLARLMRQLQAGENVLVQAFSGTGKTALAGTLAQAWLQANNGTVLWLRAGSGETDALFEALAQPFGRSKEVASAGEAKAQTVHHMLHNAGVKLLVLDDCWNGEALSVVLKAAQGIPTLVTARRRYPLDGIVEELPDLQPEDALRLLLWHWKTSPPDPLSKVREGEKEALALCGKLGNLAFAVEIAGRVLKTQKKTPAELLHEIEAAPHDLTIPLEFAAEGRQSVAQLLDVSLKALDEEAQRVFLAFGAFFVPSATPELLMRFFIKEPEISAGMLAEARKRIPEAVDADDEEIRQQLIGAIWENENIDVGLAESPLGRLLENGLAERVVATDEEVAFYRIHDLAYAYAKAFNDDELRDRAMMACLAYTWRYNTPSLENFKHLRPELDNFMGAAEWAFERGYYESAELFAWNLYANGRFLSFQGFYTQSVRLLNRAVNAAERQSDRRNMGEHLVNLGIAHINLGQYDEAVRCYKQGLDIAQVLSDKRSEAKHLGGLGSAYRHLGWFSEAIECHNQALTISRELGDKRGEGSNLGGLGSTYMDLKKYVMAVKYYVRALDSAREINDEYGEETILGNLAGTYAILGQHETASKYLRQALSIAQSIGHRQGEARHIGNLGITYSMLGEYEKAINSFKQARAILEDIGLTHMVEQMDENIALAESARDAGAGEGPPPSVSG